MAATKYVTFESGRIPEMSRLRKSCFDECPAATCPMTVATVDKLVRTASEAAFGSVLAGGKPGDKGVKVKISIQVSLLGSI